MINPLTENLGLIHQLLLALQDPKKYHFKKSDFYPIIPKNANNKNTLAIWVLSPFKVQ